MLKELTKLVYEAGALVRGGYQNVENKGTASNMVTDCDVAVQRFLVDGLEQMFPGIGLICEESAGQVDSDSAEITAVIDPIDGTANFVRGMNLSAVSVAILRCGKPWLAAVYAPFTDEMFTAETGKGAWCNGSPIRVSDRPLSQACMSTAWSTYDKSMAGYCFDLCQRLYPQIDDLRRLGSCALEMCYVACGRCELFFEIRIYPWDHAAAGLIVREAGGCAMQMGIGDGDYSRPTSILAANTPAAFAALWAAAQASIPASVYDTDAFAKLF